MAVPVFKSGNTALITGGASGIGLALAKKCRSYGMKVAIVDNNTEYLDSAKKSVGGEREGIETFAMDVCKLEDWGVLKAKVEQRFGRVDLLSLNAGIGLKSSWEDVAYFHKIMDVNLFGVINGISTFLPVIQAQKTPSAIIITGSKQGITNPPGNPAYNASKAAVKTLAEHLSYDLRSSSTSVHLLVPGWTFTGLSGGGPGSTKMKPDGAWSSKEVVDYLERKMAEANFYIICPDNDVTEETDKKRMMWSVGDAVHGRQPLSRWREEYKAESVDWMANCKV